LENPTTLVASSVIKAVGARHVPSKHSFCLLFLALSTTLLLAGCRGVVDGPTSYQLTVTAPPSGAGTIASSPAGISCPGTCTATFASGTVVMLTASPAGNYTFGGWSGACSGTNSCSLTMTAAESVTANFNAGYGLAVSTTGSGTV